ncbi:Gfo/Idh/MocA family protein [Chryseosolibacter indicus]|uniref:Gfo/Idh/MocA family oxidoreductase n=1 Tax=Chryseosolibacter indicus TaxID=2782351 RepID=A0ABS5VVX0_9BACT|nr:Gfo/Idh/MocA family oxidoreductase [Chryseosolibacter indicus]MBT1705371.1 Gfo/Idh/MocA family oxidoreductase [Chryseosolibacter indicus]
MDSNKSKSRRSFLKKAFSTAIIAGSTPALARKTELISTNDFDRFAGKRFSVNDQVNLGIIGMGIMGFNNAHTALQVPGVKLVGVCDLYSGRLDHAKELFGKDLFVTKNYRELLDRKDIDAVVIATSDHWHDRISIEAMNKGKHVYCEKPMVHKLEEGAEVIATQKKTGKVFQVGSQRVSSIVTLKAKEIFESGVIGELVLVETWMDRQGGMGAWQYSIPTDAKAGTVDWDAFIGDAPKVAYDPVRFFRWRNYKDYGTGIAGDLFVHLFSGLHTVTSSKGPNRIYATGGLRYWKDGRDVPDIICGLYDYPATDKHPAFTLQTRVNFADGGGGDEKLRLVGTDGVITLGWNSLKVERNKTSKHPGYGGWDSFDTFTTAQQKEYEKWYNETHLPGSPEMIQPETEYKAPEEYSASLDHHINFYKGIREKAPIKEDAIFSMRAAGPALASNKSLFDKKIVNWDPETAKVVDVKS